MPYDVRLISDDSDQLDPNSMISDLQFGQMINRIKDRNIFVFIDVCFAGTFVEAPVTRQDFSPAEVPAQSAPGNEMIEPGFDFLGNVLARTRSIFRDDAVVICASQRNEVSWAIRRDGGTAIATRFFSEALEKGSAPLTVDDVFNSMSETIPAFLQDLRRRHPHISMQIPVLQGDAKKFILKK